MNILLRERMILRKKIRRGLISCCVIASILTSAFAMGNTNETPAIAESDILNYYADAYKNVKIVNSIYDDFGNDARIEPLSMISSDYTNYLEDKNPVSIDIQQEEIVLLEYTEYTVKSNDTLWEIASSTYGTGEMWETISSYNEIDPDSIVVGQVIKIPADATINHNVITSVIEPKEEVVEQIDYEPNKINNKSDLAVFNPITIEQMNNIIAGYQQDSPFQGRGDVFIKASEVTGLNPLYIFGHASLESGYGTSNLARTKHNYFGIGAFDSDPGNAYALGDSMENGIINGAKWIKENYYDKGYVSLYDMIHTAPYAYASAGDKWISDIVWIANANINLA